MGLLDWVLFVHVVAGALWFGGVMWQEGHTASHRADGEEAYTRAFLRAQATNDKIFPVATILLIGTALWMVFGREYLSFGTLWIDLATALFVLSFLTGVLYFGRGSKKAIAALEEGGYTPEIGASVRTMHMVGRIETIVLLVVVWLMVFKPGA